MKGHLVATLAEFIDLHLVRMGLFVPGGEVVVLTAFAADKDYIVTFARHNYSLYFLSAGCSLS